MGRGLKERLIERGRDDLSALKDALTLCIDEGDHEAGREIRKLSKELISVKSGGGEALELYWKAVLFDAKADFDSFMLYLEHRRPPEQQFWLPRRKKLLPICRELQNMEDGKLDELFLSCPPRIGKSTLIMMFLAWVMGRDSERSNLYCSFTDAVVQVLYNGILEILSDEYTYSYFEIFPTSDIASTNAKDLLINLERKKRYASFTGRSLYGTLNGACDCGGYLVGDDLISGIEEALSKDRLNAAWAKVDNNLLPRAKEKARILWIGTRWSLTDPQGRRIDLLANDPKYAGRRWKALNIPALDEKGKSNFEYDHGVGFSTDFFEQRRASFERNSDMASWLAQYQGEPIERDGAVFSPEDLSYYNGVLPEGTPDRVFMAVDPAWGGGDYVAAPVCYQFGNMLYVADVVYNDGDKRVTQPLIERMIKKHNIQAVKIEGTKMTSGYGEDIDKKLKGQGIRVNMMINVSHYTGKGKEQRIFDKAADIRENMVFLADGYRSKEYSAFMQNVYSFTVNGKNKHDDAPDSLCMAIDMAFFSARKAEIIARPF